MATLYGVIGLILLLGAIILLARRFGAQGQEERDTRVRLEAELAAERAKAAAAARAEEVRREASKRDPVTNLPPGVVRPGRRPADSGVGQPAPGADAGGVPPGVPGQRR